MKLLFLLLLMIVGLLVIVPCGGQQTCWEVIRNHPELTNFSLALELSGLDIALANNEKKFTVFAPSDDAINSIAPDPAFIAYMSVDGWIHHLRTNVQLMIVPNQILSDRDIFDQQRTELRSLNGTLAVSQPFASVNLVSMKTPNQRGSNGVVHIMHGVIKNYWRQYTLRDVDRHYDLILGLSPILDRINFDDPLNEYEPGGTSFVASQNNGYGNDSVALGYYPIVEELKDPNNVDFQKLTMMYNLLDINIYEQDIPEGYQVMVMSRNNIAHMWVTKDYEKGILRFNDAALDRQELADNGITQIVHKPLVPPGIAMLMEYCADYTTLNMKDMAQYYERSEWDVRNLTKSIGTGQGLLNVFAPLQDGFSRQGRNEFDIGVGIRITTLEWIRHLWNFLLHITVEPAYTTEELYDMVVQAGGYLQMKMLSGFNTTLEIDPDGELTIDGARFLEPYDMKGVDGYIHLVEQVPLPPSILYTTYEQIQQLSELSEVNRLMDVVQLGVFIDNLLPVTLFAAVNSAWDVVVPSLEIEDVLKNMIFELLWFDDYLADMDGEQITSVNGKKWNIQVIEDPTWEPFLYAPDKAPARIYFSNTDGPEGLTNCTFIPGPNRTNILSRTGVIHHIDCLFLDYNYTKKDGTAPTFAPIPVTTTAPNANPMLLTVAPIPSTPLVDCGPKTCSGGWECCNEACGYCVPPGKSCNVEDVCTPCGTNLCGDGEICCNESCGTCVAPGGTCSQSPCEQCGPATCGPALACCNESCGVCTEPGGACTVEFCGTPCGPNVCLEGKECCNESCGLCVPFGSGCSEEYCSTPCGKYSCPLGQECCNESCGTCVEPGGVCTLEFCTEAQTSSETPTPVPQVTGTVLEVIKRNPDLSKFAEALALSGLDRTLMSNQQFTVFAPLNWAMDQSPAFLSYSRAASSQPVFQRHLSQFLQHCITDSVLPRTLDEWEQLLQGQSTASGTQNITMLDGLNTTITLRDDRLFIDEVQLLKEVDGIQLGNTEGSNGIIHVVDQVLLTHPAVGQSVYKQTQQNPDMSTTLAFIDTVQLGSLMENVMPLTFFSPVNSAWDGYSIPTLEIEDVLKNLMFEELLFGDDLAQMNGQQITSYNNKKWQVHVAGDTSTRAIGGQQRSANIYISNQEGPIGLTNCTIIDGLRSISVLAPGGLIYPIDCLFLHDNYTRDAPFPSSPPAASPPPSRVASESISPSTSKGILCSADADCLVDDLDNGTAVALIPSPMPSRLRRLVRVNVTFAMFNTEGFTAADLLIPENIEIILEAFLVFISMLASQVEASTEQRHLQAEGDRPHRQLLVLLQPEATEIYNVMDVECQVDESSPIPIPDGAVCQTVSGGYGLAISEEEDQEEVQKAYLQATNDAIEEGGLQSTLKEVAAASNSPTLASVSVSGPTRVSADEVSTRPASNSTADNGSTSPAPVPDTTANAADESNSQTTTSEPAATNQTKDSASTRTMQLHPLLWVCLLFLF